MEIVPYTLLDDLPRRILSSFPHCQEKLTEIYGKELELIVVGGFAVQLHLHDKELFRPTNDMDVSPSSIPYNKLTGTEFQEGIASIIKEDNPQYYMQKGSNKNGYEIQIDPSAVNNRSIIETGKPPFFVHINQFSRSYLERHKEWKAREIENADEINLYKLNLPNLKIKVFRIEDIIANKMRRLGHYEKHLTVDENNRLRALIMSDWKTVYSIDFEQELKRINSLFELAELDHSHFGNEQSDYLKHFKVRKDLYDIATLLFEVDQNLLTFSEEYFKQAISGLNCIEKL